MQVISLLIGYYYNVGGTAYQYIDFDGTFTANMTNGGAYKAFSSNITLYARYEPKIITITFDHFLHNIYCICISFQNIYFLTTRVLSLQSLRFFYNHNFYT